MSDARAAAPPDAATLEPSEAAIEAATDVSREAQLERWDPSYALLRMLRVAYAIDVPAALRTVRAERDACERQRRAEGLENLQTIADNINALDAMRARLAALEECLKSFVRALPAYVQDGDRIAVHVLARDIRQAATLLAPSGETRTP